MSAEWERLLDAFAAAAEADEPAPAWAEPADPLPPELEARAREVLAKTRARIVRGRAELDAIAERMAELENRQRPASAPVYLDVTG